MRIPRCPSCRAYLSTGRTIDSIFRHAPGGIVHSYRLACANCLAIARLDRPEMGKDGRVREPAPSLEIAAPVVVRTLERLKEADAAGDLAGEVAVLWRGEYRVLLRVPEVLAVARPVWGHRVLLREAAYFQSADPLLHTAIDPEGRIELCDAGPASWEGSAPEVEAVRERVTLLRAQGTMAPAALVMEQGMVIILPGTDFAVLGCEGGSLLLDPHLLPMVGRPMSLSRVTALTAAADLLAPAGPVP